MVTDLHREEVVISEDGVVRPVLDVRPANLPLKLAILVDNGDTAARAFGLVQDGLRSFIDRLPANQEVSLLALTPEPRWVLRAATMSLVATGGGLVFGGDINGRFRAFDQETGEVLWEINLGSPVSGFPISYAVEGRQYVAVSTGVGGDSVALCRPHARDPGELWQQPVRVRLAGVRTLGGNSYERAEISEHDSQRGVSGLGDHSGLRPCLLVLHVSV